MGMEGSENMATIEFIVSPEVKEKGIDVRVAVFRNARISNKSGELKRLHKETVEKLKDVDPSKNPVIQEYHRLQEEVGIHGATCPAEFLIKLIKKNGRFLNINTVVDCYNVVSAETGLAIGAHDLSKLKGDVVLKVTDGSEKFIPLGKTETEKINPGEYATMDDEEVLCRLDIKQCEKSKITQDTKEFMVYVQGNKKVAPKLLDAAIQRIRDLMEKICGAEYVIGDAN